MNAPATNASELLRAAGLRAIGYAILWLMLAGSSPGDLTAGAAATLAATWTSLHLLPPSEGRLQPAVLVRLALRFLHQSVVAGVDVARRALDPRLPLRPGFVIYPVGIRPGPARNMFTTLMSVMPGTVPTGWHASGGLLIHCLDVAKPIMGQLSAEEALFARVIRKASGDG